LWVESNPDVTHQGASRAIPVEYVSAVIEVKARFNSKNVKEAIDHLADLLPLMSGTDAPEEPHKLHLSDLFCCGVVFFQLYKEDDRNRAALKSMVEGLSRSLHHFFGGIVLRAESHTSPNTGKLTLYYPNAKGPPEAT
jgi:hypothetical protein